MFARNCYAISSRTMKLKTVKNLIWKPHRTSIINNKNVITNLKKDQNENEHKKVMERIEKHFVC